MLKNMGRFFPNYFLIAVFLLMLVSGCASTPQVLKYEVDPQGAMLWPQPPEKPRYRFVGVLTGEENFIDSGAKKNFSQKMGGFFRWLVGLGSRGKNPRILQRPQSGAVDAEGRILVTDVSRHAVMVFDPKGELDEWEMATAEEEFNTPVAIAVGDNGTVYVTDSELALVTQLDHNGNPIKQFGQKVLKRPTGIARDPEKKQIYVADTHAHNIKVFSDDGKLIDVIGKWGQGVGEFNSPTHLAFAHGKLYVTDTFNTRVQILDQSGDFSQQLGHRGLYVGNLIRPKGVTTDSDGNIYVIESYADYLLVYNSKGEFLLPIGGTGAEIGQFYLPSGVWSDANDRIYVADMFNGRVVVLQYLSDRYKNKAEPKAEPSVSTK